MPVDDAPYARHPRLWELPREVRETIADRLEDSRPISAIRALRTARNKMGLREAATLVAGLQLYDDTCPCQVGPRDRVAIRWVWRSRANGESVRMLRRVWGGYGSAVLPGGLART
jgi:hypothetical protein